MRTEHLPRNDVRHAPLLLLNEPDVVALRVHDLISMGLSDAGHHAHDLQLALDHDGRVIEDVGGRVPRREHAVRVGRDADGCKQTILEGRGIVEGVEYTSGRRRLRVRWRRAGAPSSGSGCGGLERCAGGEGSLCVPRAVARTRDK